MDKMFLKYFVVAKRCIKLWSLIVNLSGVITSDNVRISTRQEHEKCSYRKFKVSYPT